MSRKPLSSRQIMSENKNTIKSSININTISNSQRGSDIENRWDILQQQFDNKQPKHNDNINNTNMCDIVNISDIALQSAHSINSAKSVSLKSENDIKTPNKKDNFKKSKSLPVFNKLLFQSMHDNEDKNNILSIKKQRSRSYSLSTNKSLSSLSRQRTRCSSEPLKRRVSFADTHGSPLQQINKMQSWYHDRSIPSRGKYKRVRRRSHTLPNSQFSINDDDHDIVCNTPVRQKMRRSITKQLSNYSVQVDISSKNNCDCIVL